MKIFNVMTRKKQEFVPHEEGKVKIYACGITVNGDAHLGHARQAIVFNMISEYFRFLGYDVTYVRNYTDIDDKIIAQASQMGILPLELSDLRIKQTDETMSRILTCDADYKPRVSQYIPQIVEFISGLIEKGFAYEVGGEVYFSVNKFGGYGKLSNRNTKDMLNGVRIEENESKAEALDFALWKGVTAEEFGWDSPWGKGRPGWHIECSAMNLAAFGDQIDIHGGGRDLIFPHHENEIAQTEALTGKQFVKYWTHNGLIKVNGQKMSKSLGNSLLLADLLEKYSDEAIKYALLQTNYRGDINITDDLFPMAEGHIRNFYKLMGTVYALNLPATAEDEEAAKKIDDEFNACMADDFNTALALSNLFGYAKEINKFIAAKDGKATAYAKQIQKTYALLGVFTRTPEEYAALFAEEESGIPADVQAIAEERWAARQNRDWAKSDELRDKLSSMGYAVKDSKTGYELTKI